jgi:hypothetical protein
MDGEEFVILLNDGRYWIDRRNLTANIHAATKFSSRWLALTEMSKAGTIMHLATIVTYNTKGKSNEENI